MVSDATTDISHAVVESRAPPKEALLAMASQALERFPSFRAARAPSPLPWS